MALKVFNVLNKSIERAHFCCPQTLRWLLPKFETEISRRLKTQLFFNAMNLLNLTSVKADGFNYFRILDQNMNGLIRQINIFRACIKLLFLIRNFNDFKI